MYKVYENHKRKIAPQYAEHKSFLVWCDDKKQIVYSYFVKAEAEKTAELLNEETSMMQQEIAELKAMLAAQSEKLAEARGFVRGIASASYSNFDQYWLARDMQIFSEHARNLLASWDSAVANTTESEVTLTEAEIDWLAKHNFNKVFWLSKSAPFDPKIPMCIQLYKQSDTHYYYLLNADKDTPANRAAILARRKELSTE